MQFRHETFLLDTHHLKLGDGERSVTLDARMGKLLELLYEAYPECCSRQALLDALWPNTVVSDWSLSRLISDFRKLCQDHGLDAPMIQTLKGRGYRLESHAWQMAASQQPSEPPQTVTRLNNRPSKLWLAALPLMALAALLLYLPLSANNTPLQIAEPHNALGRVLWVDDHPGNNTAERRFLEAKGIATYIATSTEEALTILSLHRHNAVITDMGRDDDVLAGVHLLEQMRARGDLTPVLFYTIMPSDEKRQLVMAKGAQGIAFDSTALYQQLQPFFPARSAAKQGK